MIFAIRDLLGLVFFPSIHSRHLAVLPWEVSFRKCRNSPTFLKSKQVKRFRERERERGRLVTAAFYTEQHAFSKGVSGVCGSNTPPEPAW